MGRENQNLDLFLILAVFNTLLRLEDGSKHDKEQGQVLQKLDEILCELRKLGGVNRSDQS